MPKCPRYEILNETCTYTEKTIDERSRSAHIDMIYI